MLRKVTKLGSLLRNDLRKPRNLLLKPLSTSSESTLDAKAMAKELSRVQSEMASQTVPWFVSNMPPSYFRSIYEEERLLHLNAITALQYAQQPELLLKSKDGKVFSFIKKTKNQPGSLTTVLKKLPNEVDGAGLARVKIFTSNDESLAVDVFRYGKQAMFTGESAEESDAQDRLLSYLSDLSAGKYEGDSKDHPVVANQSIFNEQSVKEFLLNCNAMYVKHSSPRRLASQMVLYSKVKGTEGVAVDIEHGWEKNDYENKLHDKSGSQHMITIAGSNVLAKSSLEKAATYLGLSNLTILRAHVDVVKNNKSNHVALNRILVSSTTPNVDWDAIACDLKYLKWVDDRALSLLATYKESHNVTLGQAEIIIAYANMLHGVLAKQDPFAYALHRIFAVISHPQNFPQALAIAKLFEKRFDPSTAKMTDAEFKEESDAIHKSIRSNVESEDSIMILEQMQNAVGKTLRTNKYLGDRYALSLRIDPQIMGHGSVGTEIPFGVFFIHGRRFNGFHVRFRDISRGGLRVVAPPTIEQHSFESSRQFNEAYSLAFAQQLKNKDIPEGGSKAVVLVSPNETSSEFETDREFVIRKSVKAFSDALLDLNTTNKSVKSLIKDYYNQDELIYLGPDENIIPSDISWMTDRAAIREYPIPRAFISSKPDAGINHKVYGVTSEGVAVFADVALHSVGINPRTSEFSVKITGGTDGDVAGNMLKILHREYGDNAKIVGICDGTGVLENTSSGLDMKELLRLVDEELPLSSYNTSSSNDIKTLADTPEGVRARNSMHNRIESDVFIPAGGRPSTINENNWEDFISADDGKPSSKLVVEGANLFITPEARQKLFENAGVVIVKDSSANKCGVICSSYEIIASMLVDTQTFLDIKEPLVDDVLEKLRALARVEAELLFREYKKDPNSALPPHSERISRAIIRLHDAILNHLKDDTEVKSSMSGLITEHLPKTLANVTTSNINDVPLSYLKCIVASSLASKIVYREGLSYAEGLSDASLSQVALSYLEKEQMVKELVKQVTDSKIENSKEIADLLMRGGVRAGVEEI